MTQSQRQYLSSTHLPTSVERKAELTWQEVGRAAGMISMGNQTWVACMEAQQFTHYATAAKQEISSVILIRCQIVSQFHLNSGLCYEVKFLHVVMHRWKLPMYSMIFQWVWSILVHKGVQAPPPFLRHPPLDPAFPLF